ncbi:hypothetical protein LOCC1_G005018 [Lachnellula occidentalis]|uniref:Uncharacterized protein n=1 Tax=Lachnellula occidentalis TaxID=215460 RepID=A0A8H8RTG5_9HELO|nr:hypothetical protein LOCC1_G005018 [Lachnellula occidentalis]
MAQSQPQSQRSKNPLDVLQGMINGILIETGRALRASDQNGSRSLVGATSRLPTTIPSAAETFHQALDDLECEIFRAKSVLSRDLEGLRVKRYVLENPAPPVIEEAPMYGAVQEEQPLEVPVNVQPQPELNPTIKQEKSNSPGKAPNGLNKPQQSSQDPPKDTIIKAPEPAKETQIPSPPASSNETSTTAKPIGLGINTNPVPTTTSAPGTAGTAGPEDSALDSLFDIPDDANGDLNYDNMEYSYNSNTNPDQSQTQNNEFDLSTFGNDSQDFTISNIPPSNDANTGTNTNNTSQNKPVEDLFASIDTTAGGDNLDLELDFGTLGAEESVFDDMLFTADGDGGADMEHGDFDNTFFGLDN